MCFTRLDAKRCAGSGEGTPVPMLARCMAARAGITGHRISPSALAFRTAIRSRKAGDTIHRYEQTPQIVATPPSICHSLGHLTKSIHFASIWSFQAPSFPRGRDVHEISSRQSRSPRLFGSADLRQELIAIAHLNFTIRRCPTCDTVLLAEARIIDGVSALKGLAFGIPRASVRVESRSRGRRSQPRRSIESRIKFDGVFRQRTCGFAQHLSKSLATIFRNSDFFAISRLPQRAGIPFTKSGGTIALRSKPINQYRE